MGRGNITRRGRDSWRIKFDVDASGGRRQTRYGTVRGGMPSASLPG